MKELTLLLMLFVIISCREAARESEKSTHSPSPTSASLSSRYPLSFLEVLDAHGGLEQWKKQRVLRFEMPDGEASEVHTIDLYARRDRIDAPSFSMGYDGNDVWLLDPKGNYEGNPIFYHNLMFYFYAMPFVLSDEGIQYSAIEDLHYNGKEYPGIGITYESGIGNSPKDEYHLYYDPQTYQMAWLGYTVTYFSDTPSDDMHWIRYNNWQEVNGLLLPVSISWYNYEGNTITGERNALNFDKVSLSETAPIGAFFDLPEGANLVVPEE